MSGLSWLSLAVRHHGPRGQHRWQKYQGAFIAWEAFGSALATPSPSHMAKPVKICLQSGCAPPPQSPRFAVSGGPGAVTGCKEQSTSATKFTPQGPEAQRVASAQSLPPYQPSSSGLHMAPCTHHSPSPSPVLPGYQPPVPHQRDLHSPPGQPAGRGKG